MKKKIVLYIPDSTAGVYLPLLWASCKSYYEIKGNRVNEYEWIHPRINYEFNLNNLKQYLLEVKPDVFGISMYIWNDVQGLEVAKWVKETFPNCLVISGGPQQYFKHQADWFEQYPFLDASLDGGEYGELTVADILDNLRDDNTVDWNLVREVVYPNKNRKIIFKSKKSSSKLDFFWDYSPYDMQREVMLEVADEIRSLTSTSDFIINNVVNGKLETTRGCPYSCAFCDWGGGIGSKVIKKSTDNVKKDINVLEECNSRFVFLCDANFGILKDRDIEIIEYMAERKKKNEFFFHVYFGGFVKSDKHTDVLKKILDIDAQNNLTWDLSYKASIQSIHQDVLDNIQRTDISFEKHIELANHLKKYYGFSSYAECISGLPGITPDKWYHEMNVFASHDMDICLYNWHLLPETPSYDSAFRTRMGMKTVNKYNNMQANNSTLRKSEVVVETFSYSKEDYKEMWTAFAIQRGFWTTGLFYHTIKEIQKKYNVGYGDLIKKIYRELLQDAKLAGPGLTEFINCTNTRFTEYYDPDSDVSNTSLNFNGTIAPFASSFMLTLYFDFDRIAPYLKDWLMTEFPLINRRSLEKECDRFIHHNRKFINQRKGLGFVFYTNPVISHFKDKPEQEMVDYMVTQMETYTKANFLRSGYIGL